jgi:hypothetical protein
MTDQIEWIALSIFIFFFVLVTVMGFVAARWKAGPVNEHIDEWGWADGSSAPGSPGSWSAAISTPPIP